MIHGQVVLTEGGRKDWISRLIAKFTGSWWTHAFIVINDREIVEAWFPKVRIFALQSRLEELHKEDRAYVVMEYPGLTIQKRWRIAGHARSFVGKWYDVGQLLLFVLFNRFIQDGSGRVHCSRTVTAVHYRALGDNLYDENKLPPDHPRRDNAKHGEITPEDLLWSKLEIVHFSPSKTIPELEHQFTPK